MFKYLWIIAVAILVLAFIAYTVYAIKDVIDSANEEDTLCDLWDDFILRYEELVVIWLLIFIITTFVSFLVWVCTNFGG